MSDDLEVLDTAPDQPEPTPAAGAEESNAPIGLFVLTAVLGLLILLDWRTGGAPLPFLPWRPAILAAVVGAVRVTFASLSGLLAGEIGADLALAIACWAALRIGEPVAAAEVVFIAMTGESLEEIAFARTRKALERLLSLWPRTARLLVDGEERLVPSEQVQVGDTVVIHPGERLPVDGAIILGETSLDESSLTGESVPVDRAVGDEVFSGTQNLYGGIRVEARKVGAETTLGQVVELVERAQQQKAPVQRAADLYASFFLPVVLVCAGLTFAFSRDWYRTVAVLVIACPCALVLATPAAVLAGIGRLARLGVLVKGGEALEAMARVNTLAFDKTGTLTLAKLEVGDIAAFGGLAEDEVLRLAAAAETGSEHPLARAITAAAQQRGLSFQAPTSLSAHPGRGLTATGPEGSLAVGNPRLMEQLGIGVGQDDLDALSELAEGGQTAVLVAANGRLIGAVGARDRLRDDAPQTVAALHRLGLGRVALLTGDREAVATLVARQVGIDEVHAEQLPADKAAWVRTRRNAGERVAMVGDGINDAPALAEAEVGIAVAETGSDIAAEAADVVLLGDPLAQVPALVSMSRRVLGTIRVSIFGFAFGLNGIAVLLSALGRLTPVQAAVFHQVGSLAVLLNSLRLLGVEARPETFLGRVAGGLRRALEAVLSLDIDGAVGWLATHWRQLGLGLVRLAALVWALTCFVPVGPDQVAVVRVLGRHVGTYGPGLGLKPWWPLGRAVRLRPDDVRVVELGFSSLNRPPATALTPGQYEWNSAHLAGVYQRVEDEALMLSGDENFVEVQAVIQYDVIDPARFVFTAADVPAVLKAQAETALRTTVAEMSIDDIVTGLRQTVETDVQQRLQGASDRLGIGVGIIGVELADVHPPLEVVPAFRGVSSAYENKLQQVNQAEAYANEQLALARGDAAAERINAAAYSKAKVVRSTGDASRFELRAEAITSAREVTCARLYYEQVDEVLAGRRKYLLDPTVTARRQLWSLTPEVARALQMIGVPPAGASAPQPLSEEEEGSMIPPVTTPPPAAAPPSGSSQGSPLPGLSPSAGGQ